MSRRSLYVCAPCDREEHNRCRTADCACCGDYFDPEPYPMEADPEQYAAEEDRRLAQQLGAWPDPPEASRR